MAIFDDVKTIIDVTAEDISEDEKIKIIIANGKSRLRSYSPDLTDEDFDNPSSEAHYLLTSYCRYAYSNAAEMFDKNYAADLLRLRQNYEVNANETSE